MKVYIDSACDIHYSSFYILGLQEIFGTRSIRFSSRYFKGFKHNNHFLLFVLKDENYLRRFAVDFTDSKFVDNYALEWSDIYGKINMDPEFEYDSKVLCIGPSFGVKIYSFWQTLGNALINYLKSFDRIPDPRRFFSNYKSQFLRPRLKDYDDDNSRLEQIYFMSSLWKNDTKTNVFRANFIRACMRHPFIKIEGGFAPRKRDDITGFEDLTVKSRVSMKTYLKGVLESRIAFNTPAVKSCHGWKLAEYLCMGKAIISTPFLRQLPEPLIDKKHYLLTSGDEQDIYNKLDYLYRKKEITELLAINAKTYFTSYLEPAKVILQLFQYFENSYKVEKHL